MSVELHHRASKRARVDPVFQWHDVVSRVVDMYVPNTLPKDGDWVISNKRQGRLVLQHQSTSEEYKIGGYFANVECMYNWFAFKNEGKGRYRLRFTLCPGKQKARCRLQIKAGASIADIRLVVNQEILVSKMFTNMPIQPPHGNNMECKVVPPVLKQVQVPALSSTFKLHPHQHDTIHHMLECAHRIRSGTHVSRSNIGFIPVQDVPDIAVDLYSGRPIMRSGNENRAIRENHWNGMVIADDVGTGKTLTLQSFVMADKARRTTQTPWLYSALVVVPRNLAKQWRQNGEKFFGSRIKIVVFTEIRDIEKHTWQQIKAADLVICTTAFLENIKVRQVYTNTLISLVGGESRLHMQKVSRMTEDSNIWKDIPVHPLLVAYDSLIVDEIDEMLDYDGGRKANRLFDMLMSVQSTYRWLLTATPEFSCHAKFCSYASLLTTHPCELVDSTWELITKHAKEYMLPDMQQKFLASCFLRHEPDMGLPPLVRHTHWVDITQAEKLILFGAGPQRSNYARTLQLCSYSAAEDETESSQGKWKTMDEIAKEMLAKLQRDLARLEKSIRICQVENEGYQKALESLPLIDINNDDDDDEEEMSVEQLVEQRRVRNERRDITRFIQENTVRMEQDTTKRDDLQKRVSYIETQISLLTSKDNTCCICFETPEIPAILPCAHSLCIECAKNVIKHQRKCPICRAPASIEQVLFVRPDGTEVSRPTASRYGSKISQMLGTVTSIVDKQERCIIFVQFTSLARRIRLALQDLGVSVSILEGSAPTRAKRVEDLRQGKLSALVLSLEESAAGIDLSCASHVIFSHALWNPHSVDGNINTMHQAIARVHRAGQTAESVHVHHFITKDTLEEELHKQLMQNIN